MRGVLFESPHSWAAPKRPMLHRVKVSFEGARRLFILAYFIAAGAANNEVDIKNNRTYFLLSGKIYNYNVMIDGRNFYGQPVNDLIKQYEEVKKVWTGKDDDYTIGTCIKDSYRLIAVDLSKQKALDGDRRAIQQIVFQGVVGGNDNTKLLLLYTIIEKSKETVLEFY